MGKRTHRCLLLGLVVLQLQRARQRIGRITGLKAQTRKYATERVEQIRTRREQIRSGRAETVPCSDEGNRSKREAQREASEQT